LETRSSRAKVAARLRSQYVVQVDYGMEDDALHRVELLQGESLSTRINRKAGSLQSTRIVVQMRRCAPPQGGLGTASRQHLPASGRGRGRQVLDFGIAKAASPATPRRAPSRACSRLAHYMSPDDPD
jgi:hypothetical protein